MAAYNVELTVLITPDVDPRQLQRAFNSYAKEPLGRSVHVGVAGTLTAPNSEISWNDLRSR